MTDPEDMNPIELGRLIARLRGEMTQMKNRVQVLTLMKARVEAAGVDTYRALEGSSEASKGSGGSGRTPKAQNSPRIANQQRESALSFDDRAEKFGRIEDSGLGDGEPAGGEG
ncbi:hypothetical protein RND64_05650 [Gordonia sp. w5E2]|uniref:Uncharacterized protein n=1 Tax=Gordonia jacobaea TaxID=122202 RepID=A0ABR5IGM0_9ACTN|nr:MULTISPECIES: hypothetical protein [Gordonia]KNA92724.1 hypothetical protein ABW18_05525 [Gordonia jacobaea]